MQARGLGLGSVNLDSKFQMDWAQQNEAEFSCYQIIRSMLIKAAKLSRGTSGLLIWNLDLGAKGVYLIERERGVIKHQQ